MPQRTLTITMGQIRQKLKLKMQRRLRRWLQRQRYRMTHLSNLWLKSSSQMAPTDWMVPLWNIRPVDSYIVRLKTERERKGVREKKGRGREKAREREREREREGKGKRERNSPSIYDSVDTTHSYTASNFCPSPLQCIDGISSRRCRDSTMLKYSTHEELPPGAIYKALTHADFYPAV